MEGKQEQDNTDSTVDTVMRNIFACCDVESRGFVHVSNLIDYIKPFMPRNTADLLKLERALDPDNINREVSSKEFFGVMLEWTKKISEETAESYEENSLLNLTPRDFFKQEPKYVSTPKGNLGQNRSNVANYLVKGYVENLLNMSASSIQSANLENPASNHYDRSFWEDEVNELRYQKRKTFEELVMVKQQLANVEEQNENLQADVQRLTKELTHVKELNELLMSERAECDELREAAERAKQQAEKQSKLLASAQKEIDQLEGTIADLELDKQKFEEQIGKLHVKLDETRMALIETETRITFKDEEYTQLEQLNAELVNELENQKNLVDDIRDSNKCLTVEKQTMEKLLQKKIKTRTHKHLQRSESFSDRPSRPRNKEDKRFTSTICTDRFDFFDYDHPYARTKSKRTHSTPPVEKFPHLGQEEDVSTPNKASPPPMYVVDRSAPRQNHNTSSNYSDEDSFLMTLGISVDPTSNLQEEMSQSADNQHAAALNSPLILRQNRVLLAISDNPTSNLQEELSQSPDNQHTSSLNSQLILCQNRVLELQNELRLYENSKHLLDLKTLELENCKRQMSEVEKKVENISRENGELRKEMEKKVEVYEQMKKSLDEYKMVMEYKNEECNNVCSRLESSLSGLRQQNEELKWKSKCEMDEIARKLENASGENSKKSEEIEDLNLKLKLEKVQTKLLTNRTFELNNLIQENEDFRKLIEKTSKEKEENLKMLETSNYALKLSEEKVEVLKFEIDSLKIFGKNREEEIAKLKLDLEQELDSHKPKKHNFDKRQLKMDKKVEKLEEELRLSREFSRSKGNEIEKLEKEISQINEEYKSTNTNLHEHLKRATRNFLKTWKHIFENIASSEEIFLKVESSYNKDDISQLKDEIELNVTILNKLAEEEVVEVMECVLCPLPKSQQHFYLKPPILCSRPASPDSPSVDLDSLAKSFANLEVHTARFKNPLRLPIPRSCPASPDSPSVYPETSARNFDCFDVKDVVSSGTSPTSNTNPTGQISETTIRISPTTSDGLDSKSTPTSSTCKHIPTRIGVNVGSSNLNISMEENSLDGEYKHQMVSIYEDAPICSKPKIPYEEARKAKARSFKLLHYFVSGPGGVFRELYMVIATVVFTFLCFCIGCVFSWDYLRRNTNWAAGWWTLQELVSPFMEMRFEGPEEQQM